MKDSWEEVSLFKVAENSNKSFVDGDWIESPYITNEGIRLIQTGNIGVGFFKDKSKKFISEESFKFLGCTEVYPGDVLICRLAEPIGRACIVPDSNERFITSVDVSILRISNNYSKDFIFQYLNTEEFLKKAELLSGGSTRQRISRINLGNIKFLVPPLPQQRKIAKILSTVDAVIEKTEAAIAKYQQLKQGLMQDVFTRGINVNTGKLRPKPEDAPDLYKASELGLIPKEWEVDKIENVSSLVTNGFVGVATPFYTTKDSGILYLFGTNIRANYLDFRDTRYVTKEFHLKQRKSNLQKGDMLTVQSGHIGTSAVIPENFGEVNCHALIITRFNESIVNSKFISYYFNSSIGIKFLEKLFIGSTIKHINTSDLSKHMIPIPNITEQNEIVLKLSDIQNNINVEQRALSKYQQLKSGLMQDLLTGEVSV